MADRAAAVELLSKIDLFSSLDEKELEALFQIAKVQLHPAGKVVFRQGDPSDSFQVVLSGSFEVYLWDDLLKIERPIATAGKGEVFGEMGLLTEEARSAFIRAQQPSETLCFDQKLFLKLLEDRPKFLLNLARTLAHRLSAANKARGIKLENLASFDVTREIAQMVPLQLILRHKVLPVAKENEVVTVAIVDPSDLIGRNSVTDFLKNSPVRWVCVSQPDFEQFRDKRLFDLVNEPSEAQPNLAPLRYLNVQSDTRVDGESPAATILTELLRTTIDAGASDLHLEPASGGVTARARIDGKLIEIVGKIPLSSYRPIVSRIKVLADLDITESRLPQDSVLRVEYGDRVIDLRLSTVPTPKGEAVACRVFDPQQRRVELNDLIVSEQVGEMVRKSFFLPNGLFLVTGPTGSGKTTTLYAGLQERMGAFPTNKLVTVEDPVEYELSCATQTQVAPQVGLTFERILRSLLRQDPDVILVGEIRDKSSMDIALEASLTGHFVLSSLHTNGVFETVTRLRQRGVEGYLIASALRGVVSQRLAPKLCSVCVTPDTAAPELTKDLRKAGLLGAKEKAAVWKAPGCSHCRMTGTKGRVGIYEVGLMSPELSAAIDKGATLAEMEKAAPPGTFVSMRRYGRFLLEKGLVSPKDLLDIFPPATSLVGQLSF